jgi:hypothetical protein
MSDEEDEGPLDVTFRDLSPTNEPALRRLNSVIFPIRYSVSHPLIHPTPTTPDALHHPNPPKIIHKTEVGTSVLRAHCGTSRCPPAAACAHAQGPPYHGNASRHRHPFLSQPLDGRAKVLKGEAHTVPPRRRSASASRTNWYVPPRRVPCATQDKFYVECGAAGRVTQLAYIGDELVGGIACRLEMLPDQSAARMYIMTVGVLVGLLRLLPPPPHTHTTHHLPGSRTRIRAHASLRCRPWYVALAL